MKTYYYTYKITCTEGNLRGCYYYGAHRTNKLDDGYKGSGKLIKDYYKKYPNGYIKEIINFYNNTQELFEAEKELISDLYKTDDKCLNIVPGGYSGDFTRTEITKQHISESLTGKKKSEEHKQNISIARKDYYLNGGTKYWKGKHLPEDVKIKMSENYIYHKPEGKHKLNLYEHHPSIHVEVYNNNKLVDKYNSIAECSNHYGGRTHVCWYMSKKKPDKNGFLFIKTTEYKYTD